MNERREPVTFAANEPVEVSFKYPDGKLIDTAFGQKTMYSTTDGRVVFAESELAAKINFCEPSPGDTLWITKRKQFRGKGKAPRVTWEVSTSEPGVIHRNGYQYQDTQATAQSMGIPESDLERDLRQSHEVVRQKAANRAQARENVARMPVVKQSLTTETPAQAFERELAIERKPPQIAESQTSGTKPGWYMALVDQTKQLVDALAECRIHAGKHGTLISADDVEKLLVTSLIGKQRQRA